MAFYTTADLQAMATGTAGLYGVPNGVFSSLIQGESHWDPLTVGEIDPTSGTSALGLGQIFPSTARQPGYGVTPYTGSLTDPAGNLDFAARYLRGLYDKVGSWTGAIQRYTGGTAPASTVAAAVAADGGGTGAIGTGARPSGCASWIPDWMCNLTAGSNAGSYANADTTGMGPMPAGGWPGISKDIEGWLKQGGLILLGVLVLVVGIWMLKR